MLSYEGYVTENKEAFLAKVSQYSQDLEINPNWLMTVMYSESGLNHRIVNSIGCGGLIQFCPPTPSSFGTSVQALISMTNVEQLDYVYKYFKYYKNTGIKFRGAFELYLTTFYPFAVGKPESFILGSEQSDSWARQVGASNKPFDLNGDGVISVGEFKKWFEDKFGNADGTWTNYANVQAKKVLRPKTLIVGGSVIVCFGLAYYAYKKL